MAQHMDFETFRRQRHGEVTSVVPLEQNVEKGQPEPPRRRRRKRPKQQSRNEKPFYRKRGTYAWLAVVIVGLLLLLALAPISFGSVKVEGLQVFVLPKFHVRSTLYNSLQPIFPVG